MINHSFTHKIIHQIILFFIISFFTFLWVHTCGTIHSFIHFSNHSSFTSSFIYIPPHPIKGFIRPSVRHSYRYSFIYQEIFFFIYSSMYLYLLSFIHLIILIFSLVYFPSHFRVLAVILFLAILLVVYLCKPLRRRMLIWINRTRNIQRNEVRQGYINNYTYSQNTTQHNIYIPLTVHTGPPPQKNKSLNVNTQKYKTFHN